MNSELQLSCNALMLEGANTHAATTSQPFRSDTQCQRIPVPTNRIPAPIFKPTEPPNIAPHRMRDSVGVHQEQLVLVVSWDFAHVCVLHGGTPFGDR